jgi:hypothetical protein
MFNLEKSIDSSETFGISFGMNIRRLDFGKSGISVEMLDFLTSPS